MEYQDTENLALKSDKSIMQLKKNIEEYKNAIPFRIFQEQKPPLKRVITSATVIIV